jgi:hypothetical protein
MSGSKPTKDDVTHTGQQWAWFVGLWIAGVLSVGSVSFLLRSILLH